MDYGNHISFHFQLVLTLFFINIIILIYFFNSYFFGTVNRETVGPESFIRSEYVVPRISQIER